MAETTEIAEVRVEFRKTVSDGSYGNETYGVVYTAHPDPGEAWTNTAFRLAEQAHDTVLSRLRASTNEQVRQALESTEEREARWERERQELDARYAREAQEREELRREREADEDWARRADAEAALAGEPDAPDGEEGDGEAEEADDHSPF